MTLTPPQIERYSRQILLKEMGGSGQQTLLKSTVVLIGAGGLGSPTALYLAAAGIGHLIIADDDKVELSNLQRQILHTTARIGQAKAHSAANALLALNPEIKTTPLTQRVTQNTVQSIIEKGDLVIDGSDNFETRYLLNEACFLNKKTLISAAVLGFEGQIATFRHGVDKNAPCYQCLHGHPPDPNHVPTCTSAGVLGALTGILGAWQATETIKELLGVGESLAGSLLLINVLHGIVQRIQIPKDPNCPLCQITPCKPTQQKTKKIEPIEK